MSENEVEIPRRLTVLIAAYDAGLHTSEGYVARSVVRRLEGVARVILVTRRNNVAVLRADDDFRRNFGHVLLVGYDLPKWASWWKRGARFYELYAYLWQVVWPFVVRRKRRLVQKLDVAHTLNFHNDSMPAMAWVLDCPSVWGPINHNESIAGWRTRTWPSRSRVRQQVKSLVRRVGWRVDPVLRLCVKRTDVIFSAGSWVDRRLRLTNHSGLRRRSQLGVDDDIRANRQQRVDEKLRLVSAGRLDWIKGLEIAISSLVHLPEATKLTIIGDGPCREFLEKHAADEGVVDRVEFVRWMNRSDLLASYAGYDLFLFPSAEAAGLSWVEALASGLPIVGITGPSELSERGDHQPGIFLAEDSGDKKTNVKRFAGKIEDAADNAPASDEISSAVHHRYGWDSLSEEIATCYRDLVRARA